nr:hypothetical protein [Tanacetum cinerariifolium]
MCIDYRELHKLTTKNLLRIDDLFDQLHVSHYFFKIDIRFGYHQLRVHGKDIPNMVFRTQYEHFKFTIMPFGINQCTNGFHGLDEPGVQAVFKQVFFIVFIDDILIYSKSKEDHEVHLKLVLELRKKKKWFPKFSKCEFWLREFRFLRHVVNSDGIHVDSSKTKKYEWGMEQEEAFQALKDNLCYALILSFPNGIEDLCTHAKRKDEAHASRYLVHPGADKTYYDLRDILTKSAHFLAIREDYKMEKLARLNIDMIVAGHEVPVSIILDHDGRFTSRLIGPELVQETTDKVVLRKEKLKAARERQKSYADNRRKLLEFEVEDQVLLKVSP